MNRSIEHARDLLLACVLLLLVACSGTPASAPAGESATMEQPAAATTGEGEEQLPVAQEATEALMGTKETAVLTATNDVSVPQGKGLLVNLTTDDTWSASMALSLATNARNQGVEPVIVFLNVRGVYLGDRNRLPATEGNSDLNIHERLQAFVAAGGRIIACPSCSEEAGLTQADYIEGVVVGEPGGIIPFVTDPNIAVISYTGRNGD
jgi:sulfur relay (sulfurtransferase) complex TusBCD TusD component (DsrE family)